MDKDRIKETIKLYEENAHILGQLCGMDVKVVNLKILKHKIIADVIILDNGKQFYRENNVEYPREIISKLEQGFSIGGEIKNVKNNSKM